MTTAVIFDPEKTWDGSEDEALRLELEAANELNERLQRALERSTEESIALRLALEDEQRLRGDAERQRAVMAASWQAALDANAALREEHAVIVAEEKARARSCVHQGLAGVSDADLAAAFVERFGAVRILLWRDESSITEAELRSGAWCSGCDDDGVMIRHSSASDAILRAKRLAEGA